MVNGLLPDFDEPYEADVPKSQRKASETQRRHRGELLLKIVADRGCDASLAPDSLKLVPLCIEGYVKAGYDTLQLIKDAKEVLKKIIEAEKSRRSS